MKILLSTAAWLLLAGTSLAAEPCYHVGWADGTTSTAEAVGGWNETESRPMLGGRELFDKSNPARWLRDDRIAPPKTPSAFVEMLGGDRLPGRVVGFRLGNESPYQPLCAHWLVAPDINLDRPNSSPRATLRVAASLVRRIVWQRRASERYEPGTLFLRSGRRLPFRAMKWTDHGVRLLADEKTSEVPLGEIAELHLPLGATWEAWLAQLAILSPAGEGRLMRLETAGGLRAIVSLARSKMLSQDSHDDANWLQVLQPAWCLDVLHVPHRQVRLRQFASVDQVPLSWLEPTRTHHEPGLGGSRGWQVDRNVQGGALNVNADEAGWGFGVHAYQDLEFSLAPFARSFRTRMGLDRLVGDGGCARGRVLLDGEVSATLYESPLLIGTKTMADSGWLPLDAGTTTARTLRIEADPVVLDRPASADPLNIRDLLDWVEPELQLDLPMLREALHAMGESRPLAWQPWQVEGGPIAYRTANFWHSSDLGEPAFQLCVAPTGDRLTLVRDVRVEPGQDVLVVALDRPADSSSASRVELRIDGERAAQFDVPSRADAMSEVGPLVIPLRPYLGKQIRLEIVHLATDQNSWVAWRGLSVVRQPPRVLRLFEDGVAGIENLGDGPRQARLEPDERFSGVASLRVGRGERGRTTLNVGRLPIRYRPRLGEYRFLRFVWHQPWAARPSLDLGHDDQWGADPSDTRRGFRYVWQVDSSGQGTAVAEPEQATASGWQVVTRDLYADFGEFDLTGLAAMIAGAESGLLDHAYLARTLEDFDEIQTSLITDATTRRCDRWRALCENLGDEPQDHALLVGVLLPGFTSPNADPKGFAWLETHAGRQGVLATHPVSEMVPCTLRGTVQVPWGRSTRLVVSVAHEPSDDWKLVIRANGAPIYSSIVSQETCRDGWLDITLDLSQFAGDKFGVELELENQANGWQNEVAYWGQVEVMSE